MQEASETGMPVVKPLFMVEPSDARAHAADDQFMLGWFLMVTPVLDQASSAYPARLATQCNTPLQEAQCLGVLAEGPGCWGTRTIPATLEGGILTFLDRC